ncbi:MAG: hypothetical protein IRZ00_07330 [Gemmatimonadetes bacterium]|nr:hypothetical protein [Gemmatimonadota bacterium]
MKIRMAGAVVALTLAVAGSASAQVAWDSPMLASPRQIPGLGIHLMSPTYGDLGVMGTWRARTGNIGLRFGVADDGGPNDDVAVFGGVDVQEMIAPASADFPLDVAWAAGVGLGAGDAGALVSVPLGLSLGRALRSSSATFTPYVTPRVILDAFFGDGDSELDLRLAFDVGVDLTLQPGWSIRFGGSFADRDAVSIGAVFHPSGLGGRAASVR